ncbi:MAG: hypothetical protein KBA72_16035 [Thermoanaerobaculia bacterium]|nr:hypothetical protein [Thermoanaerobaculia bacterium]
MSTSFRLGAAFALTLATTAGALAQAAAKPAAAPDGAALVRLRTAEFETALAREPKIYLVLDPKGLHLDIKSRAMVLERVELEDLLLLEFEPLFSSSDSPELSAPTLWKVTQGPGDTDRETIAPVELRPYSEEEEKEEPVVAPAAGAQAAPAKKKPDETTIPTSYRATLDNGWQLYVTAEAPQSSFFRRLVASVRDGWQRLRGEEPQHPSLITMVVAPAGAQRLHHLFRSGTEILVLP